MKLDAKSIATLTLPPDKRDVIVFDQELVGFGLRLRSSHGRLRKSWVAQYRANGRTRRVKLGPIEKLGPAQAREAARKILAGAALGHDPQGEKKAKRQQVARTFRSVVDAYLAARQRELRPE